MSKVILERGFIHAQVLGTLFIMLLGMTAAVALVIGAIWLVSQFVLLVFSSLAELFAQMGETWHSADSLTRLLMLVCIALAGYWMIARRKDSHA